MPQEVFREIKDPGTVGPGQPVEFDPPSKRSLTLTCANGLLNPGPGGHSGSFVYVSSEDTEPWTGTWELEEQGEMTNWIDLRVEKGGKMKGGEMSTGKTFNTMIQIDEKPWFQAIEDHPGQLTMLEMKVSARKPVGFYIKSAASFLKGIDAKEASNGKEAVEAKPPVDELKVSGLGEAIDTAVSTAARTVADGLATISKIETSYPEMPNGRGCALIVITLKRK